MMFSVSWKKQIKIICIWTNNTTSVYNPIFQTAGGRNQSAQPHPKPGSAPALRPSQERRTIYLRHDRVVPLPDLPVDLLEVEHLGLELGPGRLLQQLPLVRVLSVICDDMSPGFQLKIDQLMYSYVDVKQLHKRIQVFLTGSDRTFFLSTDPDRDKTGSGKAKIRIRIHKKTP